MSPTAASVTVGLAVVGVLAGLLLPVWAALPLVGAVAVGVVTAAVSSETRQLRRTAEQVNRWLGDGERRPVELRGGAGWRQLAVAVNAVGAAHRRLAARLEQERPWRRELVDALVSPALLFNDEGRLSAANTAARELLGIPVDAGDITVVQAVGSAALADAVREVRQGGGPVTLDLELGEHDLRAAASPVGEQLLLVITDRTRERRVEELRRNFVVNASHELKTPVAAVQTLAEALAVTIRTDPDRAAELVPRLGDEAVRLSRLVHDLLDLRRLEERGPLERVPVDLAELTRRTVADLIPRAEAREVTVGVEAPDTALVAGVAGDLETIVANLVTNAIEYNRPGGSVEVTLAPFEGSQVLTVRDSGIGIAHQDLTRVFERFYRVDPARSRETGGTGLGLSIVRHAVERHGGTITVDSLLGDGTTFTVVLPIEPPR